MNLLEKLNPSSSYFLIKPKNHATVAIVAFSKNRLKTGKNKLFLLIFVYFMLKNATQTLYHISNSSKQLKTSHTSLVTRQSLLTSIPPPMLWQNPKSPALFFFP